MYVLVTDGPKKIAAQFRACTDLAGVIRGYFTIKISAGRHN